MLFTAGCSDWASLSKNFRPDGGGRDGGCVLTPTAPIPYDALNTSSDDRPAAMSPDGLTLVITSSRPGGLGMNDLWITTRPTLQDSFVAPVHMPNVNSSADETTAAYAANGLTLYLDSTRAGGAGSYDIWFSTRPTLADDFGTPSNLPGVNTASEERAPTLTPDGFSLLLSSDRAGGLGEEDIWMYSRASSSATFGTPVDLAVLSSTAPEWEVTLSADGLTVIFSSDRGVAATGNLWMATRTSLTAPFSTPMEMPVVNTVDNEDDPVISPDGTELYFTSDRNGNDRDIYFSQLSCE
jgi:hypothetical protein